MYSIVEIKGKQYKAVEGSVLKVDYFGEEVGSLSEDIKVLLFSDEKGVRVGTPYLDDVEVSLSFVENLKAKKVIAIRFKSKTNQRKIRGHRQNYTRLRVDKIASK